MKRWPVILTGIIDTIYKLDHELGVSLHTLPAGSDEVTAAEEKIKEGKGIIEKISKLKYDMARDRPLECVILFIALYLWPINHALEDPSPRMARPMSRSTTTSGRLFVRSQWMAFLL